MHHGLVVLVQQNSPTLKLLKKTLHGHPHSLQFLEGDVLIPVLRNLESSGRLAVVEDCPPTEAAAVGVEISRLDGSKHRPTVLPTGNGPPPLQIPLELMSDLHVAVPADFGLGDIVQLA